ncbi:MAG: hypothetical protein KIT82_07040 [Bradyrhizobium sp.]|nr:hypothetical protein [Bradyrhizobium sp.]
MSKGDTGYVYHYGSPPSIEGRVTVIRPVPGVPDLYVVRFDGERRACRRLVLPGDWQKHPERTLNQLRALWRVSVQPEFLFPEFPWRDRVPGSTRAGKARRRAITRSTAEGE